MADGTKHCSGCNQSKSADLFYSHKRTKDGLSIWCRECNKRSARESRLRNPEKRFIARKRYEAKNRDKILERVRLFALNNPSRVRQYKQKYAGTERGALKARLAKGRRRTREAVGTVDPNRVAAVIRQFNNSCVWCGGPFEHLDHVISLARGGAHAAENLAPSCAACNHRKSSRDHVAFGRSMGVDVELLLARIGSAASGG